MKLFEGSFEDRYHDPGHPFAVMNGSGKHVLETTSDGSRIYLHAEGASPEGDRPFLAVMNVANGESKRMWQSEDKFFESAAAVLETAGAGVLIRRESPELPPNFHVKDLTKGDLKQVTLP